MTEMANKSSGKSNYYLIVIVLALTTLMAAIDTNIENYGLSRIVVLFIVLTILFITVFLTLEHRINSPLIRLNMFKDAVFSGSLAISAPMLVLSITYL